MNRTFRASREGLRTLTRVLTQIDTRLMKRGVMRLVLMVALALMPASMPASAWAHGGDETQEGYLLVQQALAHLAHDTSADGIDLAMEKVNDALETKDQEGVSVPEVQQGMDALESGDVARARALLQDSITEALADLPLATGYDTGTSVVSPELHGRGPLAGGDWVVLGLSIATAGVGVWLSIRFRPHESMSALRLLLGTGAAAGEGAERRAGTVRRPR